MRWSRATRRLRLLMTHPSPRALIAALAAFVILALITTSIDGGEGLAAVTAQPRIGPGVQEAFAREPDAAVIVTLRQPTALRARRIDVRSLRSQVASAQDQLLQAVPAGEFRTTRRYTALPVLAGRVSEDGLKALEARPDVTAVQLDTQGTMALNQSAPLIYADEVQATGLTGAGIIVAVIDTGIDTDHADLADSIAYERCFLTSGACPPPPHPAEDNHGHGTNVSGIITSNGTVAPRGVAPDAQIAAYKVLNAAGNGVESDWLAALDDIIANHPEVDYVNMSLQSSVACPDAALETAVSALRKQGVGTFIAAGNHGTKDSFATPSCVTEGISVGAAYDSNVGPLTWSGVCTDTTTATDQVACWSDSSPDLDLLGPGAYITSTGRNGSMSTYRGTSQATPHAVGVAALLKQAIPTLSLDEIEARLKATGTMLVDDLQDGDDNTNRRSPRVDARVALLTDDSADYDGDGCTNGEEFGTDINLGGKRNPLSFWDYMNPTGDGMNRADDILAVVDQYFIDAGNPDYTEATDRTVAGPYPWSLGPPNGMQRIDDVLNELSQYFHDCLP